MKKSLLSILVLVALSIALNTSGAAQTSAAAADSEKCTGLVYKANEVSFRAKIISKPSPSLSEEARTNNVRGRVVLNAILCRSGKITDIQAIEELPFGMTNHVIEAARAIEFIAARRDGRDVSQTIRLEYNFYNIGERGPLAEEPVAGKLIECVEFDGLMAVTDEDIWKQVRLRPGEVFDDEQLRRDFQAILALGLFDKRASYFRIEQGKQGGICLVFFLKELPRKSSAR